jgi:hypothetical protein
MLASTSLQVSEHALNEHIAWLSLRPPHSARTLSPPSPFSSRSSSNNSLAALQDSAQDASFSPSHSRVSGNRPKNNVPNFQPPPLLRADWLSDRAAAAAAATPPPLRTAATVTTLPRRGRLSSGASSSSDDSSSRNALSGALIKVRTACVDACTQL